MLWVIAYDIQRDRIRRRVARRLERFGFRRQFSVFEGESDPKSLHALLDELAPLLDPACDRITAWPLGALPLQEIQHLGQPRPTTRQPWGIL